jgi:hypothetical protein
MALFSDIPTTELFDYHAPDSDQIGRIEVVRNGCRNLALIIRDYVPESAERTLAIRKLEEVSMWANKAIVFNGQRYL